VNDAVIIKELTVSQLPMVFKSLRERKLASMVNTMNLKTETIGSDMNGESDHDIFPKLRALEQSYNSICRIRDILAMPAFHGNNGVSHYYEVRVLSPVFYLENAALECHVLENEH
jgi:hypothetical protein